MFHINKFTQNRFKIFKNLKKPVKTDFGLFLLILKIFNEILIYPVNRILILINKISGICNQNS